MLRFFIRLVTIIAAVTVLLDAWLPDNTSLAQVDRRFTSLENNATNVGSTLETHYHIELIGGHIHSCTVGYRAYSTLQDGDKVRVTSTRLLKFCRRIERGGETVFETNNRLLVEFVQSIFALLLLAASFGWLRTDRDGGVIIYP